MKQTLKKIYEGFCKVEAVLCGSGLVILVLLVFLSAVLRLFRLSVSWNIDMALFLLAWTAFWAADMAWRSGNLMGMDLVLRRLPLFVQKIFHLFIYAVVLAALSIVIIYGSKLAWMERLRMYQSIPIPYSVMTLSLITASISMIFTTILKIRRCVLSFGQTESAQKENAQKENEGGQ